MAELYRYAAFISYSSKDAAFAHRLHRALESYGIPSSLGKFDLIGGGGKQNRIYPVFRDREELSAGHLGDQIEANLKASAALIVVCSPNGAASPWVQKEIEFFAAQGRHGKIFAIIPDTAPLADEAGADATQSCFPPAFRGDALTGDKLEPLAADARKGKDGFRNAWLKIVAGMIGVSPGQIIDRDKKRRQTVRRRALLAGCLAVAVGLVVSNTITERLQSNSFASESTNLLRYGRRSDASPFAVAALPAFGSAQLPSSGAPAAAEAAGLRIPTVWDLGETMGGAGNLFSPDGRYLILPRAGGGGIEYAVLDIGTFRQIAALASTGVHFYGGHLLYYVPRDVESSTDRAFEDERQQGNGLIDLHTGRITRLQGRVNCIGQNHFTLRTVAGSERLYSFSGVRDIERISADGIAASCQVSTDGNFIVAHPMDGPARLYDLRRGLSVVLGVGESAISDDAQFLIFNPFEGPSYLMDLARTGVRIPLGNLAGAHFSKNGRFLLTQERDPSPPSNTALYREGSGNVGMTMTAPHRLRTRLYRLDALNAPVELGFFNEIHSGSSAGFIDDGDAIVLQGLETPIADVVLFSAANVDARRVIGRSLRGTVYVAQNGRLFLTKEKFFGPFVVQDLSRTSAPIQIGGEVEFDQNSSTLISGGGMGEEGVPLPATLYQLASSPIHRVVLGPVEYSTISPDGRYLMSSARDQADLRALDRTISDTSPQALKREICSISAYALRPLGAAADRATSARLAPMLRGRPWNPCDWRGLLAIIPNAERGDGWFEGARQWVRLMHVRYFGGKDWHCAETTSAASAQTRAARARMCQIAAPATAT